MRLAWILLTLSRSVAAGCLGDAPPAADDQDPSKVQTDYRVCLTAPAFQGDRLTACDP